MMVKLSHPKNPAIYHITHVDNLASIVKAGKLWCDSQRIAKDLEVTNIGYEHIKERRLKRVVDKAAGGFLGDYVPFNFCNRSVMLYVIYRGHENYAGGQRRVVHLVSSVQSAIATERPWAFTRIHADLGYAKFYDDLSDLKHVDWEVMPLTWWSDDEGTKERRQAEFLVHRWFPWTGIESIGVRDDTIKEEVERIIGRKKHKPPVTCQRDWYY
jgi:hypothetical protein